MGILVMGVPVYNKGDQRGEGVRGLPRGMAKKENILLSVLQNDNLSCTFLCHVVKELVKEFFPLRLV